MIEKAIIIQITERISLIDTSPYRLQQFKFILTKYKDIQ
jgi:hypothetical protein